MGACFIGMNVKADATKKEVKAAFAAKVDNDGYEYGHSYSGSFSEFSGLSFTNKEFDSVEAGDLWLEENGQKWGPCLAVKVKDGPWMLGGWVSE